MKPQDQLILTQAIIRHKDAEKRKRKELPIYRGPGGTSVGSIFDCSRSSFERVLHDYSSSLYVGWNPFKNEGRGCWEIWHRPSKKTKIPVEGYTGPGNIYTLEYRPNDFEHHVYDLPFLTYSFVDRLREMDMWANKQWIKKWDDRIDEDDDELTRKETERIHEVIKDHKSLFRKLKGLAQDGYNPLWFFSDKRQGNGQV